MRCAAFSLLALLFVTTSFGIEGFGLTPGRQILVADSAAELAANVINLLRDRESAQELGNAGRRFMAEHYSHAAAKTYLTRVLSDLIANPPKQLPFGSRAAMYARQLFQDHIAWRLPARG